MSATVAAAARRGCFMTRGLYLKANGELPCWDDVGEARILRKLDPVALREGREGNLSGFAALRHIRERFALGELPHPGLCETCAVRAAGPAMDQIDDAVLQVLHVEPSFMCHLSCPQCIPQKLRKSRTNPPYHLAPDMYDAFLRQLRSEGVRDIKLIIFEGRGDPLSCPDMESLLEITKTHYPRSSTCITTHGSFPYKPWIATSKLDVIRFSVDGARQENYQRYRIGGRLDKVFGFMEALKSARPASSRLYVEWKYILFEWNDTDEELAEAAVLAERLGAQLRFCRTHSPGRSTRYASASDVAAMIRRVAPGALQDLTFQLKDAHDVADVDVVRDDQIRSLVGTAIDHAREGDEPRACAAALEAMRLDQPEDAFRQVDGFDALDALVTGRVDALRLPVTAELLAGLFRLVRRRRTAGLLLTRCAALLPPAGDRRRFEIEATIEAALAAYEAGLVREALEAFRQMIAPEAPPDDAMRLLGPAIALDHAGVCVALGNLFEAEGHRAAAITMFDRYLALAPHASDWEQVARHLTELRRDELIAAAHLHNRSGHPGYAVRLMAEGALIENALAAAPLALADLIRDAASIGLLDHLSTFAADAADFKAAYQAERRIRSLDRLPAA